MAVLTGKATPEKRRRRMEAREADRAGRWGAKTLKRTGKKLERMGMTKTSSDKLKDVKTRREQAEVATKLYAVPKSGTKYGRQNIKRVNAKAGRRSSGEKNEKENIAETRLAPAQGIKYVKAMQKVTKLGAKSRKGGISTEKRQRLSDRTKKARGKAEAARR